MANQRRLAFLGGQVFTADARNRVVTGVYAEDGVIRAVGAAEEVRKNLPGDATVIDISGRTLVPGFIDSHNHMLSFGATLEMVDARYPQVASIEDLLIALGEAVERTPEGQWVRGRGFDYGKFPGGRMPTRWEIDPVSPRHPVSIVHVSGHFVLVNSAALRLAGISDDAPDPKGGQFIRDERGRMTGMLLDAAIQAVIPTVVDVGNHGPSHNTFPAPLEELVANIDRASQRYLEAGLTAIVDAQVTARELLAYLEARRQGRLHVRTTCMLLSNHLPEVKALGLAGPLGDDWLALGPMKFYCDGSLIGCTAAFQDPYRNRPESRGSTYWSGEELRSLISEAHGLGLQVGIHTQGDRAHEMSLNAIEAALRAHPREDHRHRLEHAGYPTEGQLGRMARLGVLPISQPRYLYEVGDNFLDNLGPERARRLIPLRSQLELGIPIVLSTDAPVVSYKPLETIYAAVTRRSLRGQDLGVGERISVAEALRGYTINAARSVFQEGRRGSIEVGKLADFTLVGGDLLGCDPEEVPALPVEMTVVDGRIAYHQRREAGAS